MFIVVEGIDGCGKSTQIFLLAKYLSSLNKYAHILITRNPCKDREIRKILRQDESPEAQAEKLTELFIQDRIEHTNELVLPNLEKNVIVISDRYKYSTICYQAAQGQDIQKLIDLQKSFPLPDFIFVVDVSLDMSFERMNKEKDTRGEQKFEKSREFQEKVRANYLKLPELLPDENIIVIDGSKSVDDVFEQIKKHFVKV